MQIDYPILIRHGLRSRGSNPSSPSKTASFKFAEAQETGDKAEIDVFNLDEYRNKTLEEEEEVEKESEEGNVEEEEEQDDKTGVVGENREDESEMQKEDENSSARVEEDGNRARPKVSDRTNSNPTEKSS